MNKKTVIAILAAVLVLAVAAVSALIVAKNHQEENIPEATTVSVTEKKEKKDVSAKTAEELYDPIILKYKDAISKKLNFDQVANMGVSELCAYFEGSADLAKVGYLIEDIDDNGTPELLIGNINGDEYLDFCVLEMYTIDNGKAVSVFQSYERNMFFSLKNGEFENMGSSSAFYSTDTIYTLAGNGKDLKLKEGLIFDSESKGKDHWFKTKDNDGKTGNDENISTEEAQKISMKYDGMRVQLKYTKLSDYKGLK